MKDENSEKIRERVLLLIDAEFESDSAFEKSMSLSPKTVNNWRRGTSSSYMKLLPKLSSQFKINVSELLDIPLQKASSELSDDELELLTLYRKTRTLPHAARAALSESLKSTINLYLASREEQKAKKKRTKKE